MGDLEEKLRVEILRIYYGNLGLTEMAVSNISNALHQQFVENNYCEVGGSIIIANEKNLELKIVKSEISKKVESSLNHFIQGHNESVPFLYTFAKEFEESFPEKIKESENLHYFFVKTICDLLEQWPKEVEKKRRRSFAELYQKHISERRNVFTYNELNWGQKKIMGIFHLHYNGSRPSYIDLNESQRTKIPDLVISATSDYQETGITLYLVHSGEYEILYQGPLQPKEA